MGTHWYPNAHGRRTQLTTWYTSVNAVSSPDGQDAGSAGSRQLVAVTSLLPSDDSRSYCRCTMETHWYPNAHGRRTQLTTWYTSVNAVSSSDGQGAGSAGPRQLVAVPSLLPSDDSRSYCR